MCGRAVQTISQSWHRHWPNLITLFNYPDDIRKVIYTTNAIESVNSVIRKAVKNRKLFPHDQAAMKVVYLVILKNATQDNGMFEADSAELGKRVAIESSLVKPLLLGDQVHRYEKLVTTNIVIFPYQISEDEWALHDNSGPTPLLLKEGIKP